MLATILVALLLLAETDTGAVVPLPPLDPATVDTLTAYLDGHALTPEAYVVSKFRDHDLVFIGENHWIKHDPELIARLIPLLYRNGVRTLGIEFARHEEQPLVDKLVTARRYDETLAREIQFRMMPTWGYREYVELYRAAWEVNHSRRPGAAPFRIVALGASPDWSLVKTAQDRNDPKVLRRVWAQGDPDEFMGKVILDEIVARHDKALIYSGLHHAFTEFRQPIVDFQKHQFIRFEKRMGNYVYESIGKRAITIALHAPWPSRDGYGRPAVYPVDGVLDALLRKLPEERRPIGFDTKGTPLGDLTADSSAYGYGYDHFTLAALCDGYVLQKPLSEYRGVTPIPGFVTPANLERARAGYANPDARKKSVEEINRDIAEGSDVRRNYAHLQ